MSLPMGNGKLMYWVIATLTTLAIASYAYLWEQIMGLRYELTEVRIDMARDASSNARLELRIDQVLDRVNRHELRHGSPMVLDENGL